MVVEVGHQKPGFQIGGIQFCGFGHSGFGLIVLAPTDVAKSFEVVNPCRIGLFFFQLHQEGQGLVKFLLENQDFAFEHARWKIGRAGVEDLFDEGFAGFNLSVFVLKSCQVILMERLSG